MLPPSCFSLLAERIGADALYLGCHLGRGKGELAAHSRRYVYHLNAPAVETDLLQQLTYVFHSTLGV
jgi:hypothetical protein